LRHLPAAIRGENPLIQDKVEFSRENDSQTFNLANMEAKLIANALSHTNENRTEAAKLLGISRRTLQRKIKESQ
jgi:transcriptional regulator with PAS, ATPase and Fis domain